MDTRGHRRALAHHAVVLGGLMLLSGCDNQKTLPVGPSDPMRGIVVYEHANYLGASAQVTEDVKDLKDFKGPCLEVEGNGQFVTSTEVWNDCISSVRVTPGWRATLYRDDDFDGDQLQVTEDIPNLQLAPGDCDKGGFNDCVTSVRLIGP